MPPHSPCTNASIHKCVCTYIHTCIHAKMHIDRTYMHAYVPIFADTGSYRPAQCVHLLITYRYQCVHTGLMCTCEHEGIYSYIGACANNLHTSCSTHTQTEKPTEIQTEMHTYINRHMHACMHGFMCHLPQDTELVHGEISFGKNTSSLVPGTVKAGPSHLLSDGLAAKFFSR